MKSEKLKYMARNKYIEIDTQTHTSTQTNNKNKTKHN